MLFALLALAAGGGVVDAERAFAAKARADGQWTAFRAFAAPDAVMYAPGPVPVAKLLAGKRDPAMSITWSPTRTIMSCDGTLAYSSGSWTKPDGASGGDYGTVWRRRPDGWRFVYEGGHEGGGAFQAGMVREDSAACPGPLGSIAPPSDSGPVSFAALRAGAFVDHAEASDGPMPVSATLGPATLSGASADRTLAWAINPAAGGKVGAHLLRVWSWDGRRYRLAVLDWSAGG